MSNMYKVLKVFYRGVARETRGHNSPGAELLWGRRMTAGGLNSQECHKHFLQYSTFGSGRSQFRTWGRQTCFLLRAPSNLVTPLLLYDSARLKREPFTSVNAQRLENN